MGRIFNEALTIVNDTKNVKLEKRLIDTLLN